MLFNQIWEVCYYEQTPTGNDVQPTPIIIVLGKDSDTHIDDFQENNKPFVSVSSQSNGSVSISYLTDDCKTEELSEVASFDVSDIVNTSGESQPIKYMNMPLGTYVFTFTNCIFNNVDFYLTDDIEGLAVDDSYTDTEIVVPSQDFFDVTMYQNDQIYRIGVEPETDFTPNVRLYSENNIGGVLKIIDDCEEELLRVELEQTDEENLQEIECDFQFEEGRQYFVEITSSTFEELPEYIYHFQIYEQDE